MYAAKFKTADNCDAFYTIMEGLKIISRFTFRMEQFIKGKKYIVKIGNVRLKESKSYCGQHAGPCQINPMVEEKHRKSNCLEGADWVAFNDMVNDALDLMNADCQVSSSACTIRIGGMRCVHYIEGANGDFHKVGFYEDCRGQHAPKTKYPDGTPGIDTWRI